MKDILLIGGVLVAGVGILSFLFGFKATILGTLVFVGFYLIGISLNIVFTMLSMKMDKTLHQMKVKRKAEEYVDMAYLARDHRDKIERGHDENLRYVP